MNKVSVIVFTHKRALLLDCFINSLINNFENLNYPINIIYHFDNYHHNSYLKLFDKLGDKVRIIKRSNKVKKNKFYYLLNPLNIFWYIKFKWIRDYFDNFKEVFEQTIDSIDTKYVLISTDDQVIYNKTYIPSKIFNIIDSDPKKFTFRLTSSLSFNDSHKPINIFNSKIYDDYKNNYFEYLTWKSSNIDTRNFWNYRFHVDGTIFDSLTLLNFIKPILYNMPTTLEGAGLWESRLRGYFNNCLGLKYRSLIGIQASNIQVLSDTPKANFDLDNMMRLYLDNYSINYNLLDFDESQYIFIPKTLPLIKDNINYKLFENNKIE